MVARKMQPDFSEDLAKRLYVFSPLHASFP